MKEFVSVKTDLSSEATCPGIVDVLVKWKSGRYDAHQHPPLPIKAARGNSTCILFGVWESTSSEGLDDLRGMAMWAGEVLMEGASEEGD